MYHRTETTKVYYETKFNFGLIGQEKYICKDTFWKEESKSPRNMQLA